MSDVTYKVANEQITNFEHNGNFWKIRIVRIVVGKEGSATLFSRSRRGLIEISIAVARGLCAECSRKKASR